MGLDRDRKRVAYEKADSAEGTTSTTMTATRTTAVPITVSRTGTRSYRKRSGRPVPLADSDADKKEPLASATRDGRARRLSLAGIVAGFGHRPWASREPGEEYYPDCIDGQRRQRKMIRVVEASSPSCAKLDLAKPMAEVL